MKRKKEEKKVIFFSLFFFFFFFFFFFRQLNLLTVSLLPSGQLYFGRRKLVLILPL